VVHAYNEYQQKVVHDLSNGAISDFKLATLFDIEYLRNGAR